MTVDDDDPWAGLTGPQLRMLTTTRRQTVSLEHTVRLLEQRLEEQQAETRHWLEVSKHQLRVVSIARQATQWWTVVCDRYPRLSAPWVGSMNVAIAELDEDRLLIEALRPLTEGERST